MSSFPSQPSVKEPIQPTSFEPAEPVDMLEQKPSLDVFEEHRRTNPAQLQLFDWEK